MAPWGLVLQDAEGAFVAGVMWTPHLFKEYAIQQRADLMRFIAVYVHRKFLRRNAVDTPAAQRCNHQYQGAQAPSTRQTHI
jgi:hypothetical protein